MALPRTKQQLSDYILRKLGNEFVPVELSITNLEDIIEEAIAFFQQNYYGFSKDVVIKIDKNSYLKDTGTDNPRDNVYQYQLSENVFTITEMLKSGTMGLPSNVFGAGTVPQTEIDFMFQSYSQKPGTRQSFFDLELLYQNFSMVQNMFLSHYVFDFNSNTNILTINNPVSSFPDNFLYAIATVFDDLDNDNFNSKYYQNNEFMQYVVLLAHCQVYNNLKKFTESELPGGIRINISSYDKFDELEKLKENILQNYCDPSIYGLHSPSDL